MTRPMVLQQRSLASFANDQRPPSVNVTKHPESPEVAIMTLTQSAFSHDTARLMIKVQHSQHTQQSKLLGVCVAGRIDVFFRPIDGM